MGDLLERIAGPGAVSSGSATFFTGTAAHTYTIRNILIVNNSGGSITIKVGVNGIADANLILPAVSIDAGGMGEFSGVLTLSGTETIQANTSGAGLTMTISGLDQS